MHLQRQRYRPYLVSDGLGTAEVLDSGLAMARIEGRTLPPVELIQVGDEYFVRDRHHRISVVRALGEHDIEAEVTARSAMGRVAGALSDWPTRRGQPATREGRKAEYRVLLFAAGSAPFLFDLPNQNICAILKSSCGQGCSAQRRGCAVGHGVEPKPSAGSTGSGGYLPPSQIHKEACDGADDCGVRIGLWTVRGAHSDPGG